MTVLHLAANNGEIAGGEVMLLAAAEAARDLGVEVHVVGPSVADGTGVVDEAARRGFATTALAGERATYLRELRSWDRERAGVLWCHGLVPATATAGHPGRVVHLHQAPTGAHAAAARLARRGALRVLAPSLDLARRIPGATAFWNWTGDVAVGPGRPAPHEEVVLGFLGRPSTDKGLTDLARALEHLERDTPGRFRLLVAGEPRFVSARQQREVDEALAPVEHLVERVGWMAPHDLFARVDVAVFASRVPESFGLVAAEAMSAGVPFVISDAGALPEVAGAGHPWVAPAGEASRLAKTVAACAAQPPADRADQVRAARRRWERHFSPDAGRHRVGHLLRTLGLLGAEGHADG